jgi:flagellar assembly protein FliH
VSYSRHKISLAAPLRAVRVNNGRDALGAEHCDKFQENYRAGFDAGQKALGEQLVEQRKQLLELQNGVLRSMERTLPALVAESERSLVLLALEAARQVVHQMPIDAALVERIVRGALDELQETSEYEVLLHPEDLALLRNIQSGLLPPGEHSRVRFNSDPRVSRGDCIVNTRHGSIASVREHMFEKLQSALLC